MNIDLSADLAEVISIRVIAFPVVIRAVRKSRIHDRRDYRDFRRVL